MPLTEIDIIFPLHYPLCKTAVRIGSSSIVLGCDGGGGGGGGDGRGGGLVLCLFFMWGLGCQRNSSLHLVPSPARPKFKTVVFLRVRPSGLLIHAGYHIFFPYNFFRDFFISA